MEDSTLKWFAKRISHGGLVSKKQFNELVDQAHQKITNEFLQARIEENESMLQYAKTHGDERMVFVLTDRINNLKSEIDYYIKIKMNSCLMNILQDNYDLNKQFHESLREGIYSFATANYDEKLTFEEWLGKYYNHRSHNKHI